MKKWISLFLGVLLLMSHSAYAFEKAKSNKSSMIQYKDNNDMAISEQPNFLEGMEDKQERIHLSINGFEVYSDYFPENGQLYTEKDGTLMVPLMAVSEMMGAVFANKDEKTVKFEKNGKAFVFEKESNYYRVGKEKRSLRHALVEKDKVLYVPFYDLMEAYEMLIYIDRNKQNINFNKVHLLKYAPYEVQVIVWDKEMQLFKKDNPDLQKIVHAGEWTAKYNKLFDQENRTDYVLLDTKSRYSFQLLSKDENGKTGFTSKRVYLEGFISPVQNDGSIKTQLMYSTAILENGQPLWFHQEGLKIKSGKPYPFTVKYSDLEEAGFLAFHIYSNNIMTVVLNPFYKAERRFGK